jgi:hypothetical protein
MPFLAIILLCLCAALDASTSRVFGADASSPSPAVVGKVIPRAIWTGLVLATNDPHPAEAPSQLRRFAGKLRNIFGYNQFELIGENSEKMEVPSERWLIPSKEFYLNVKTHPEPGQKLPDTIILFQNRRRLAEFETHLTADSPLFIRGPQYARGQLVIVVHVSEPGEAPGSADLPIGIRK